MSNFFEIATSVSDELGTYACDLILNALQTAAPQGEPSTLPMSRLWQGYKPEGKFEKHRQSIRYDILELMESGQSIPQRSVLAGKYGIGERHATLALSEFPAFKEEVERYQTETRPKPKRAPKPLLTPQQTAAELHVEHRKAFSEKTPYFLRVVHTTSGKLVAIGTRDTIGESSDGQWVKLTDTVTRRSAYLHKAGPDLMLWENEESFVYMVDIGEYRWYIRYALLNPNVVAEMHCSVRSGTKLKPRPRTRKLVSLTEDAVRAFDPNIEPEDGGDYDDHEF